MVPPPKSLLRVVCAGLVLAAPVARAALPDVEIDADELTASRLAEGGGEASVEATGDVRVGRGMLRLRAPRLTADRARREVTLTGGVVGVDGLLSLEARSLTLHLDSRELELEAGTILLRGKTTPAQLRTLLESGEPRRVLTEGTSELWLKAQALSRTEGGRLSARSLVLTTCACAPEETPLLSIRARQADILPGDEARLTGWMFRLFGVPLLPFDMPTTMTLPLVQRRTGFLFPRTVVSGPGGPGVEAPFFLELGESADLTLRPRWQSGGPFADTQDDTQQSHRGLGLGAELRWRPSEKAAGQLRLDGWQDTALRADGTPHGRRWGLALDHAQPLLGGRLGLAGETVSDNALLFDTNVALDRAQLPYLRSQGLWSRTLDGAQLALGSAALQDLRGVGQGLRRPMAGMSGTLAPALQAEATASRPLPGDGRFDATLLARREAALPGLVLAPGRGSRSLVEVSLGEALPLVAGRGYALAAEAGERFQAVSPDGAAPFLRGGAYAGGRGELRLERTFAGGWRHRFVPSVRLRTLRGFGGFASDLQAPRLGEGGLALDGDAPARAPSSAADMAMPSGWTHQATARLSTELNLDGLYGYSLFIEKHASLFTGRLGQMAFGGGATFPAWPGRPALSLGGSWNEQRRELADASARMSLTLPRGSLSVGTRYMAGAASDQVGRGLDVLFDPNVRLPTGVTPLRQADVGFDLPLVRGVRVTGGAMAAKAVADGSLTTVQYWGSASYDAGGCARLSAQARVSPPAGSWYAAPVYGFGFELGDVGAATAAAAASLAEPR